MVNNKSEDIDLLFHALSDTTRRTILSMLSKGEHRVSDLAKPFDQSLASISKHLKVLVKADLVRKTKAGREYSCKANIQPLSEVYNVLEGLGAYWRNRLDALDDYFNKNSQKKGKKERYELTTRKRK